MELADLKHFNTLDMLKYLAYLQVCQENSSHLQILQELQNRVLKGEDIISDENSWEKLEDAQIGLFVEITFVAVHASSVPLCQMLQIDHGSCVFL